MFKINNEYTKIGTDQNVYLENYINNINTYDLGTEFEIAKNGTILYANSNEVFICNSNVTLIQNIESWIAFGFFIKISRDECKYIKAIDYYDEYQLKEKLKAGLFIPSDEWKIQTIKNTLFLKILCLENENFLKGIDFKTSKKIVDFKYIIDDLKTFEKELFEDKKFVEIVKILGETLNDYRR